MLQRITQWLKLSKGQDIIYCTHKTDGEKPLLSDKNMFNLGTITLWLCTNCGARLRETVVTNILYDAAALSLRSDGQLQQLLKERVKLEIKG